MKVLLIALVLGVLAPWVPSVNAEAVEGTGSIVLLHSNDVHCSGLDTTPTTIGYAGIAQAKATAEATYGEGNVTLIDAGDAIQGQPIGTISKGGDLVDIMDAADYDVAVPGNHEFDYGIPRLVQLSADASFPYVSCNIMNTQTNESLFSPYDLIDYEVNGETVRVAYVGITTPTTLTSEAPTIFEDEAGQVVWSFYGGNGGQDLYQQVQTAVDEARETGEADYVIAVAHLGMDAESGVPSEYTSTAVIANTTGIDGLIDGHTHQVYSVELPNKDGEDIPVAQCGTGFQAYGTMTITPDGDPGPEDVESTVTIAEDLPEPVPQDASVAAVVTAKQDALASELQRVIGTSVEGLSVYSPDANGNPWWWTARMRETNLGDFVADAYRSYFGADIAFVNGGGIRAPQTAIAPLSDGTFGYAAGSKTYNDMMSINSFGNTVSMAKVSGQSILDALEYSVRALTPAMDDETENTGSFLQVSGITFTADISIPTPVVENAGGGFDHVDEAIPRRVSNVMVGGKAIDPDGTYTLASIPVIFGGNYTMFADPDYVASADGTETGIDYDILATYLQEDLGGTIGYVYANPAGSRRIILEGEAVEPSTVPVYRLYNPYLAGAHLFTSDLNEVQTLTGEGWVDEGIHFTQYADGDFENYLPVYRLWNPSNGDHLYTIDATEAGNLVTNGWKSEGAAFWAPTTSPVPVQRLYNPYQTANGGLGNHLWTTSRNEVASLIKAGWNDEGVGWYAVAR